MNAFFASPLAFFALLAIPALVAIYLFRNQFRVHHVSSLILWENQSEARQGGLHLTRIQTPLLFFLELLTILMLITAAAGPMIRSQKGARGFVVILDNSFSMLADAGTTPRERASKEIRKLLSESGDFRAHFILAGKTPQLISEPVTSAAQVVELLSNWKCTAPAADLNGSIALANELAGKTARILVITDHTPEVIPEQGRIEWWAFGTSLPNLAFVNASRTSFEGRDRCFFAVTNFSDEPVRTRLTLESLDNARELMQKPIELQPHQTYTTVFEPETALASLRGRLPHDNLDIDNEVVLAAESPKPLRVQANVRNEILRSAVDKVIKAVRFVALTSLDPQLLITDSSQPMPVGSELWTVQIISAPDAAAYVGPFVSDRSHRLTEGLFWDGIIWGAGKSGKFTGLPVIAAGDIPLVTDKETPTGSHAIAIYLNPELSTLLQSPNWPILISNLIQWRKLSLPGLSQSNILLGSSTMFTRDSREKEAFLVGPDQEVKNISALSETARIEPDAPGLYALKTEKNQYTLSVNAVSQSESDLTRAASGKWGAWRQERLFWWEYRAYDWVLLLTALALLTAHRFVTATYQKGV